MRTEFIQTKVRPIIKLFIINLNDNETLHKILIETQDDIAVLQNLIFVNDNDLWSESNKEFVKRSDPDIIFNFSDIKNETLSRHFGISTPNLSNKTYTIARFVTNLYCFTRKPSFLNRYGSSDNEQIDALGIETIDNTNLSLTAAINYGLCSNEIKERLELSIFKNLKPTYLTTSESIFKYLFKNDHKFNHLTSSFASFGGSGKGSSIYYKEYNKEKIFDGDTEYIFVSDSTDLKTISYFWNTRSYYSFSNLAWIPINLLEKSATSLNSKTIFVSLDRAISSKIKKAYPENQILEPKRLYFKGANEKWVFFEHNQTINITDKNITIQHPVEKTFYEINAFGAMVFEISGINEFLYPKRSDIGNLFLPNSRNNDLFQERFSRISKKGLSKYVLEVSPLNAKDIIEVISLPSFYEVIEHIFQTEKLNFKKTTKSAILEQTVNLLGGLSKIEIVATEKVFNLLIGLTPQIRTEKTIKKLLNDTDIINSTNKIMDIISDIKNAGAVQFPSVILNADGLLSKASITKVEKSNFILKLQELYNKGILFRGKHFVCNSCNSKIWLKIDNIKSTNHCPECNNIISLPIFLKEKQESDHYRLNQLMIRAIDQGQLATILTLNLFYQQKYYGFEYLSNLEVFKNSKLLTDIDLLIKIGKRIGIVECKSNAGFPENQILELIKIGKKLQVDFIAFSNLLESSSDEINTLKEVIDKEELNIPIFILCKESLFNVNSKMIHKHFEIRNGNDFKTGAIII